MSKEKSVDNYYMVLNGIAYEPFSRNGIKGIKAVSFFHRSYRAEYRWLSGKLTLTSTNMPNNLLSQCERDIYRNSSIIMEGL